MPRKKRAKHVSIYNTIVIALLVWCTLQDFALPILLKITGAVSLINILFYLKDIVFVLLFLYSFIKQKGINAQYTIFTILYFALLSLFLLIGINKGVSLTQGLSIFRGWMLLPCFYCIGHFIRNKKRFVKKTLPRFFLFYSILALIGIGEYLADISFGTKEFWLNVVDIDNYMDVIKGQGDRLVNGLPGNMYGSYGGAYLSTKRLCSVWASPLSAAYNLVFPVMYYLVRFIRKKESGIFVLLFINALALILTITRAILLLSIVAAFIVIVYHCKRYRNFIILGSVVAFVVILIAFRNKIGSLLFDGSTKGHTDSIIRSLTSLDSILGSGIGTFGIGTEIGTESTYLSCLGQLGIIGLILFAGFILNTLYNMCLKFKRYRSPTMFAMIVCIALIAITGFISEQMNAFTSSAICFVILGFYSGFKQRKKMVQKKNNSLALCSNA